MMKKWVLFALLILLIAPASWANVLEWPHFTSGAIVGNWNPETAKREAFRTPQTFQTLGPFATFDPWFHFHRQRLVASCSEFRADLPAGSYGIREFNSPIGRYYDVQGRLYQVEHWQGEQYPYTVRQYAYPSGELRFVWFIVSTTKRFRFSPQGDFQLHQIGNIAYPLSNTCTAN